MRDLLGRMTLEEKVMQMVCINYASKDTLFTRYSSSPRLPPTPAAGPNPSSRAGNKKLMDKRINTEGHEKTRAKVT